jgi:hypothetical protein
MNKTVYYGCGCVFTFEEKKGFVVSVDKEFTLCYKHGFDMYKEESKK